uniref:Secreted protein n=1 Tax=Knipowitschia caucasica TaxID=637954 RepID=A0AAV2JVI9_KNICA
MMLSYIFAIFCLAPCIGPLTRESRPTHPRNLCEVQLRVAPRHPRYPTSQSPLYLQKLPAPHIPTRVSSCACSGPSPASLSPPGSPIRLHSDKSHSHPSSLYTPPHHP